MGDDAGMGNDEKGCYIFEHSNGFLFVVCALSFIVSLALGPVALVHLERALCGGRESGAAFGCGGFEDGVEAAERNSEVEEEGDVGGGKEASSSGAGGHISSK